MHISRSLIDSSPFHIGHNETDNILEIVPEYKIDCVLAYIQGLLAYEIPNAETVAALNEAEQMKEHPEQYKSYNSFDEVLKDVLGNA